MNVAFIFFKIWGVQKNYGDVCTKAKVNSEWNIFSSKYFFGHSTLSFWLVKAPLKLLLKLKHISFNFLHIFHTHLRWTFSLRQQKNIAQCDLVSIAGTQCCVSLKTSIEKGFKTSYIIPHPDRYWLSKTSSL